MNEELETLPNTRPFGSESIASNCTAILTGLGLLAILFYIPGPIIPVSHPYKAELVLTVVLVIVWLAILISGARFSEMIGSVGKGPRRIFVPLILFVCFGLASGIWATSFESVFHHTTIWVLYLASFYTFLSIVSWQKSCRFPIVAVGTAAFITGILCLIDYFTMSEFRYSEGFIRIRYGKYGEMMSTIAPLLAAGLVVLKGRLKVFAGCCFLLSWLTVMLSLSKGAFLAGIAGISLFFIGAIVFDVVGKRRVLAVFFVFWLVLTAGFQVAFSVASDVPATTDYISGAVDPNFTSSEFRKVIWRVGAHMAGEHWLIGWGADNFGRRFNDGRASFRKANPQDASIEFGEDYLVERAHNEPIQILSELGLVGGILICTAFFFAGALLLGERRSRNGLFVWASLGGSLAFAFSSMVSSFSFRSAQNGIAFFLVLAAGVGILNTGPAKSFTTRLRRFIGAAFIAAVLLVLVYSGLKIAAEVYVSRAESTADNELALADYRRALALDPEYAGAHLSMAARYASMNEYLNAAAATQKGIDTGVGMSITYSQLATQYKIAGLPDKAADAYREGVRVYPRSIYMRIEAAEYFASVGLNEEATANTEAAFAIDAKQAEGWIRLIRHRGNEAFHMSKADGMSTPPAELLPQNAVQMYSD